MAPRSYKLNKRAEAVQETRRRITEAIVELHREKGLLATTYEDIARRADVAPATVYRHFPSMDQIVPACGARILEITSPPGPEIYAGRPSPAERLRTLVHELFAFWQRVEPWLSVARCEEAKIPALAEQMRMQETVIRGLIESALGHGAGDEEKRLVEAMTDFYTWRALASAGLEEPAAAIITELLIHRLGVSDSPAAKEGRSNGRRARDRRRHLQDQQLRPPGAR